MSVFKTKEKTKDGKQWIFKVYRNGKTYKSKKYATKREALNDETLYLLKKDNPSCKKFELIVQDYFKDLMKSEKESTIVTYMNCYNLHLKPFFDKFDILDINIDNISEWHERMENSNYSVTYLNKINSVLKNIFNFAIRKYNLKFNPAKLYGNFKESKINEVNEKKLKYISNDEFNKLICNINDITWRSFFSFLYFTGMRKGEVQALTWNDINFETNEIYVNKTLSIKTIKNNNYKITPTKNYKNRVVKISKYLYEILIEYKKEVMKYSDFHNDWFVFGCSRFMPSTTIDNKKEYYFKISGLKEITIHEFRHSHVSLLINEYIKKSENKKEKPDMVKFFLMMSNRMGHTIEVMQNTYMHLLPTVQDEIVDLLDNM